MEERLITDAFLAFEVMENNTSRLAKLATLNAHAKNPVFRELLVRAYNPFVVYHIKKLPDWTEEPGRSKILNYTLFLELLNDLAQRRITGNAALARVSYILSGMTSREIKWYSRVLVKDLNIGIQAKTINEAIPGLVPVFNVMLAQPFKSFPSWFVLQPKFDGMRIIADTTTGELFSRKGKPVEGFDDLSRELREKFPDGYFLDGEILAGAKGEKIETFNEIMKQAFRKSSGKKGLLFAFDLLKERDFREESSRDTFLSRHKTLEDMLLDIKAQWIQPVFTSGEINTMMPDYEDKFNIFYTSALRKGYEGLIMKDLNSPYEFKRTYSWQKVKPEKTFDLMVIGIEPGNPGTKYENQVGRLVCDYKGIEVRVGSGLTDFQRSDWWEHPEEVVGKTVEVIAQETTTNKKGTESLRFPRFKMLRTDK